MMILIKNWIQMRLKQKEQNGLKRAEMVGRELALRRTLDNTPLVNN